MNNKSYKMLFESNQKLINKIVNKYSESNNKISIVGMAQCLYELNIFTELLKNNKNQNTKKYSNNSMNINLKQLQYIVNNIKEGERKEEEMELLEQIWFILNPNNKEFIYNEIFEGFIKLLFSYSDKLNPKNNIISYIKEYLIIVNFTEPKNYNLNNEYIFCSPLRNQKFTKNDIWPLEKIVTIFLKLKQNIMAYKKQYYLKDKDNSNNTTIEKDKLNNTFNNKDKNKNKKHDFNKLYEKYMEKVQIKEKTLEKLRELKEKKEMANCTNKPNINHNYDGFLRITNNSNMSYMSVHDKLYDRRKDKDKEIENIKEKYKIEEINKKIENQNELSFKPKQFSFTNDKDELKQYYLNNNLKKKPNGYEKYIKRNRKLIEKREKEKKKKKKNIQEKIMKI